MLLLIIKHSSFFHTFDTDVCVCIYIYLLLYILSIHVFLYICCFWNLHKWRTYFSVTWNSCSILCFKDKSLLNYAFIFTTVLIFYCVTVTQCIWSFYIRTYYMVLHAQMQELLSEYVKEKNFWIVRYWHVELCH